MGIQSATMASKSAQFFENGTNKQFEFVFSKYQEALQAKADSKNSKSEILIKLDKWYQNELPKKIKSRGKEAHLTHEEIVQTIKWKLARGQFRPRLKDLIQMNTPRVVMQESKKAFRAIEKKKDLEAAVSALSNLKGVGPAMASAVLAAGAPEIAPFMADELLMSMPEVEGIDYTMKEYMKLVEKTNECVDRLNAQGGSWNPHKVEMAVWTYYIARDLKPELLDDMPDSRGNTYAAPEPVKEVVEERVNGENGVNGEVSTENGDRKEESKEVVVNQTNGVGEVDNQKTVHSMSPEPVPEPVMFNEPASFASEPMGFNYNGVGSSDGPEHAQEMPAEVHAEPVVEERQLNGESTKEVPLLENGSYNTYNYPGSAPLYPTNPDPTPAPVESHAVADYLQPQTAQPVETPVYTKRPLEEETEEATPESKRVREEPFPTPESSHSAPTHSQDGVPQPTPVSECPAPNGVNSAPPQPIHTGAD